MCLCVTFTGGLSWTERLQSCSQVVLDYVPKSLCCRLTNRDSGLADRIYNECQILFVITKHVNVSICRHDPEQKIIGQYCTAISGQREMGTITVCTASLVRRTWLHLLTFMVKRFRFVGCYRQLWLKSPIGLPLCQQYTDMLTRDSTDCLCSSLPLLCAK